MSNMQIDAFLACDTPYEEADTVLFGAPFDGTTSYRPGTRFGSNAIRRESYGIETYSPYQDKDLEEIRAADTGDIELPFGDTAAAEEWLSCKAGYGVKIKTTARGDLHKLCIMAEENAAQKAKEFVCYVRPMQALQTQDWTLSLRYRSMRN